MLEYRRERAEEIWERSRDWCEDLFDDHWWRFAWWRPRPGYHVTVDVSPWWWWRPATWGSVVAFYGDDFLGDPVYYDPGTTIVYEGDTVYIEGESVGSAVDYRREAIALATPNVAETPVPEPVAEGGLTAWLPLGVWAFTQQREGDAVMFFQISVDKDGVVAGAYKNVLTGEEQPIVGRFDPKSQRLAWHVGEQTQTVYETWLPNLTQDVASVFVHLGETQTQTWMMVRLPSPEMPPTSVKLPGAET